MVILSRRHAKIRRTLMLNCAQLARVMRNPTLICICLHLIFCPGHGEIGPHGAFLNSSIFRVVLFLEDEKSSSNLVILIEITK